MEKKVQSRKLFPQICLSVVFVCLLSSSANAENEKVPRKLLFQLPKEHQGLNWDYSFYEHDGNRLAYLLIKEGRPQVVVDGKEEPLHDSVGYFQFSHGGLRYVYQVSDGGKTQIVYHDGQKQSVIDSASVPMFSEDGEVLGYFVSGEKGCTYRIGGITGDIYYPSTFRMSFSSNGRHIIFGAKKGSEHAGKGSEYVIVADGKEIGPFIGVQGIYISDDGKPMYVARTLDNKGLFRFGDLQETAEFVDGPKVSKDFRKWAYITGSVKNGKLMCQMVLNGSAIGGTYERIPDRFCLSEDGSHVAYIGRRGKQAFVVVDGVELGDGSINWEQTSLIGFSPDGTRFAYAARLGEETMVFYGDYKGPSSSGYVQGWSFSPDSRHFAYVQIPPNQTGTKRRLYLDGEALGDFDRVMFLNFSEDSTRFIWVAADGDKVFEEGIGTK